MGDLKQKVLNLISSAASAEAVPHQPEELAGREVARVGSALRATRIQAGLELRDVATMLKIRFAFMEAIEDGRYQDLPGTAYAVGFVRTYAEYLGLDADAVVRRFKDEVSGKVGHQSLYFPTPVPEGRVPGGAVLLVSLLLAVFVYGGWYVLTATDRSIVDVVPALPQRLLSLLGGFSSHNAAPTAPAPAGSASAPEVTPSLTPPPAAPGPMADQEPAAPTTIVPAPTPAQSSAAPPASGQKPAAAPATAASTPAAPAAGAPTAAEAAASPATTAAEDAGDEVPLVSGPSDENSGGPGPLVPMAPRTKPVPPALGPAADAPPLLPLVTAGTPPAAATPAGVTAAVASATTAKPANAAATPPQGRVFGNQGGDSRVQIKATQDTWVQIREATGDAIFTKVLHAGDIYRVPDHPGIRLRTGNAGGLQLIVGSGEPSSLGQIGEVLRDVPVDGSSGKRSSGR